MDKRCNDWDIPWYSRRCQWNVVAKCGFYGIAPQKDWDMALNECILGIISYKNAIKPRILVICWLCQKQNGNHSQNITTIKQWGKWQLKPQHLGIPSSIISYNMYLMIYLSNDPMSYTIYIYTIYIYHIYIYIPYIYIYTIYIYTIYIYIPYIYTYIHT